LVSLKITSRLKHGVYFSGRILTSAATSITREGKGLSSEITNQGEGTLTWLIVSAALPEFIRATFFAALVPTFWDASGTELDEALT
jgi:hypothetical protein